MKWTHIWELPKLHHLLLKGRCRAVTIKNCVGQSWASRARAWMEWSECSFIIHRGKLLSCPDLRSCVSVSPWPSSLLRVHLLTAHEITLLLRSQVAEVRPEQAFCPQGLVGEMYVMQQQMWPPVRKMPITHVQWRCTRRNIPGKWGERWRECKNNLHPELLGVVLTNKPGEPCVGCKGAGGTICLNTLCIQNMNCSLAGWTGTAVWILT